MRMISMFKKIKRYVNRVNTLESRGWYRNLAGGMTDSHCMGVLTLKDIYTMSEKEFSRILSPYSP